MSNMSNKSTLPNKPTMPNSSHYIPTLRTPDDCRDWLERNKPLPTVHRGEVWFARLGKHKYTAVQEGIRPVLIVSNEANNRNATTVTVIPFTGSLKRTDLPTHVVFDRLTESVLTESVGKGSARAGTVRADTVGAASAEPDTAEADTADADETGMDFINTASSGTASSGTASSGTASSGTASSEYKKSMALVEQVTTLDKRRLINKIGRINDSNKMEEINRAVMIQFGLTKSQ